MTIALTLVPLGDSAAEPQVPPGYVRIARAHGVPADILYAVALAESGKALADGQGSQPWPWTLNLAGEGRYYPSWRAANADLQAALGAGTRAIDIGLMQVSWRWFGGAFGPAESLLSPYRNLAVGATILARCYRTHGSWCPAVGCYHAPNDAVRAARYRERVRAIHARLGEDAQVGRGG